MNFTKKFNKNKGITLIALVVTIIVLLILAGISISMLTGQNGILNRAAEAKEKNDVAQKEEQIKLAVMAALSDGTGTLTIPNLKKELASYGITIAEDATFPVTVGAGGNNYTIAATGEVTKVGSGSVTPTPNPDPVTPPTVPEGLKVGDTVTYSPSGTYTWQGKYCSSSQSDANLSSASGQSYNITEWKVLSIENGKVELVPTAPTSGTVYLGQAQGYNNGVKLLNDACSSLYGNTSKGITARSLNIDDIEKYMLEAKVAEAHQYQYDSTTAKYGNQLASAYTSNKNYPSIYAKENLSVINGNKKTDGLGMSEQSTFMEKTEDGVTDGKITTATSIQPYQTYWYKDNSFMQTAFRTAEGGENYYNLLINTSKNYWLASRCVYTYSSFCNFGMRLVVSGGINAYNMYCSRGSTSYYSLALFPVVSLSSSLLSGNATSGYTVN